MNPFQKHDVSDFPDTYVPLTLARRHHSVISAHGDNLAGLAPDDAKSGMKIVRGDGSQKGSPPPYSDESTLEALRAEIDADVAASGHDTAYDRKAKVINKAIMVRTLPSFDFQSKRFRRSQRLSPVHHLGYWNGCLSVGAFFLVWLRLAVSLLEAKISYLMQFHEL